MTERVETFVGLRGVLARSLRTALVVAVVLTLVNQGGALRRGQLDLRVAVHALFNFLVPFCVASYSQLSLQRRARP